MTRVAIFASGLALMLASEVVSSRAQSVPSELPASGKLPDESARTKSIPPAEIPSPPPDEGGSKGERLEDYLYSTDQAIEFYKGRVGKDSRDYMSLRVLGELYLRRATGEGGGLSDFARAESALRRSLAIHPKYIAAQATLAGVLCQRHKFAEALGLAKRVLLVKPQNHEALAIMADALIEMGRYEEGKRALADLSELVDTAPVLARQANLAELEGTLDRAERLIREAIAKIRKAGGSAAELAWYQARLGDFALAAGRLDEADTLYMAVSPGTDPFHDASAGRARIAAFQGRLDEATALYEKAVEIGPDPHMLAALGDLDLSTGRKARAGLTFARLLEETKDRPEYLRERATFFADHDRDLPRALELAENDFAGRQDVHGHDVLAWALFKNGRLEQAAKHSAEALKLGTRDPLFHFHAAMIHDGLGDRAKAADELRKALAIQPRFSVLYAESARKRLEELERAGR